MRPVALGPVALRHLLLLEVGREGDVGDLAVAQRRAAGEVGEILDVIGAHDALVEDGDVHEELVELDVLLGEGADQVVIVHAGDREHGLAVELGVVEAVEEVDPAGAGGGEAARRACRVYLA